MTKTIKTKTRADSLSRSHSPLMDSAGAQITLADALARQEYVRQEVVNLFKPYGVKVPTVEGLTFTPRGTFYWSGLLLVYSTMNTKESLVVTKEHLGRRMHDVMAEQLYCVPSRDQQLEIWAGIMKYAKDALARDTEALKLRLKRTNIGQMTRDRQADWDAATKRIAAAAKSEGPNMRKLRDLELKEQAMKFPYSALLKLKQAAAIRARAQALREKKARAERMAQLAQEAQA